MKNIINSASGITVIMPTYKQAQFILRAINSLFLQDFSDWELIIINDGSPDNTKDIIDSSLRDHRITYIENRNNFGLGYCMNLGLEKATYDFIAYLPSDDIYYKTHLKCLYEELVTNRSAILIYSAVKSEILNEVKSSETYLKKETALQLVQVLHRKTLDRWSERSELVSDDYNRLFFEHLKSKGEFISHNQTTCEWISHPEQRSKIINEKYSGGIYKYKLYYGVVEPIRFQSSTGNYIDESKQYAKFQSRRGTVTKNSLKILIVGELAFNPERICAFEERGHKLYGLWMRNPRFFNTIGPLAFGDVETIPYEGWEARVREIKPDIIYSLLNWQTVSFAHEILKNSQGVPFVWHFKEDPFFCIKSGIWKELLELYSFSDGRIYINDEVKNWFDQVLYKKNTPWFILDGDLPKNDWFNCDQSPLLSDQDGEIHTVLPGRVMGFRPEYVKSLADQKIHLHFYGEIYHNAVRQYIQQAQEIAKDYFHVHPNCNQDNWISEFSRYDAGWLHLFESENFGEIARANWDDLNYPARIATLAAAGVPMLQKDNFGHIVATQSLCQKYDMGVYFKNFEELGHIFRNKQRLKAVRNNAWDHRGIFQFDSHVDNLINFFRQVIDFKKNLLSNDPNYERLNATSLSLNKQP